ncbi:MAG: sn-glycerol-3-phosphate ABC transporter ATP-binding protein UgpC [Deltaproteobacteria bacterium]|nr:MAG: sn-glycerol-3-phosphate ABC transporter ATP-binding protein UgpC [Deltaproteobacteria bacterium]
MAGVTLNGLYKRYGSTSVLEGIDLDVEDGEYIVLVGPSGCGKSTLLRCIAGLEEITAGTLEIGGRRVNDLSPRARNVAMVFQSYALYPHMTVRRNMGFALEVARRPKAEIREAVEDVAAMLDLVPLLDRLPGQLSGGQRQRVAMGRAIVRRPDVFLFDEPLSNLDASLRHHMRVELKHLHRRLQTTVFHVTHDQVEALTLADRIVVLHQGVVQQVGTPRELFDRPANTFVGTFIGSPSMALLPAVGAGGTVRIDGLEGELELPGEGAMTLGLRPTDIEVGRGPLRGQIEVIESLGAEALLHLDLGPDRKLVAQVPEPCQAQPGEVVSLLPRVVHRFHAETGERLP